MVCKKTKPSINGFACAVCARVRHDLVRPYSLGQSEQLTKAQQVPLWQPLASNMWLFGMCL